jgi:hypothetical protein
MTRVLATVLCAVLAAGCSQTIVTYPSYWGRIERRADCSAVVGTYSEKGERAPGGYGGSFLRFTHLATYDEIAFRGPHVTLSFPEPDIFLVKAGGERRFRFTKGEVTCHKGRLELRRSFHSPTFVGPGRQHETVALARSTDGWLIARWERTEWVFLLGFIPTYGRQVEWYRFETVGDAGEPSR